MFRPLLALATVLGLAVAGPAAAEERVLCVYDPMGTNGQAYKNAQAFAVEATAKGVTLKLRADVEERTAQEDLVAGKCDAALLTGVSTRSFGLPSATIEAIGALPRYDWLKATIGFLKDPKLASKAVAGNYENAGIFPAGMVLLHTHDKRWTKATDLAGKTVAIIGNDAAASTMAREVGMSTKSASTATFGPMYNSGSVDTVYAPATAFEPLELYRGVGTTGGVVDFPLSQLTLQLVLRRDRFPEGFGQWGREWAYAYFDKALTQVKAAEAKVAKYLVAIPEGDKPGYEERFLKVRLALRDQGVYDKTVLGLMRRVRCASQASRAECAAPQE